ncbi:hypothetical protein BH10PSE17_BH10PSE17_37870 [soil metagenome]
MSGMESKPRDTAPLSVSVAMCTHNGASFVEAQLLSIFGQSRLPDEIVVVDDCSTDDTWAILQRVGRGAAVPLRLYRNSERLGVTRNFEKSIALTTGEFVFLSDQDDLWNPEKIDRLLGEFVARPDLWFLHTDARLVNDQGEPLGSRLLDALEMTMMERRRIHAGSPFDVYIRRNLATGATAAFRRELFNSARPFPDDWLHDEWLALIAAAFGRADLVEQELIDYRQHDSNHMGIQPASTTVKLSRMFTRRGDFHRRMVRKVRQLHTHLLVTGAPAALLKQVSSKLVHAMARRSLPAHRAMRVPAILREAFSGRYWLWSSGWRSILRDLGESIPQNRSEGLSMSERPDSSFDHTMPGSPISHGQVSAGHATRGSKRPRG